MKARLFIQIAVTLVSCPTAALAGKAQLALLAAQPVPGIYEGSIAISCLGKQPLSSSPKCDGFNQRRATGANDGSTRTPRGKFVWPDGKRAAIVLTYDDALRSQLDVAIPQLNKAQLKGTFFLDADITPRDMIRWRSASRNGHELGNHTLYHPCPRAMLSGREHYATENYDPQTMLSEIAVMNNLLFGIDGAEIRTYSYPCSQAIVGGSDYTDALRRSGLIKYARSGGDQYTAIVRDFEKLDTYHVPSWGFVDNPQGAQLIAYIKRVQEVEGLGVLMFHGVGGDYLEVSADAHRQLLRYLREHPDIWVGTFQEVMDYVAAHRSQ